MPHTRSQARVQGNLTAHTSKQLCFYLFAILGLYPKLLFEKVILLKEIFQSHLLCSIHKISHNISSHSGYIPSSWHYPPAHYTLHAL